MFVLTHPRSLQAQGTSTVETPSKAPIILHLLSTEEDPKHTHCPYSCESFCESFRDLLIPSSRTTVLHIGHSLRARFLCCSPVFCHLGKGIMCLLKQTQKELLPTEQ